MRFFFSVPRKFLARGANGINAWPRNELSTPNNAIETRSKTTSAAFTDACIWLHHNSRGGIEYRGRPVSPTESEAVALV